MSCLHHHRHHHHHYHPGSCSVASTTTTATTIYHQAVVVSCLHRHHHCHHRHHRHHHYHQAVVVSCLCISFSSPTQFQKWSRSSRNLLASFSLVMMSFIRSPQTSLPLCLSYFLCLLCLVNLMPRFSSVLSKLKISIADSLFKQVTKLLSKTSQCLMYGNQNL